MLSTDQNMLFADDTNAFVIHKGPNELKQNAVKLLSNLSDCFTANNRTLNLNKIIAVYFSSPEKKYLLNCNSLIEGQTIINRFGCVRYLGLLPGVSFAKKSSSDLKTMVTMVISELKSVSRLKIFSETGARLPVDRVLPY